MHSPIRCHCDHWNEVEQQTGLVGGERQLIKRLVSWAGVWCRALRSSGRAAVREGALVRRREERRREQQQQQQ